VIEVGCACASVDDRGVGLMGRNTRTTRCWRECVTGSELSLLAIKLLSFVLQVDTLAFESLSVLTLVRLLLFRRKLGQWLFGTPTAANGSGLSATLGGGVHDIHHETFS
jgi:hypothetical protein